jgi:hypothetical protein
MLIQEFFGFVDLRREIRAATAVGVVQKHELAVLLADLLFVERTFPIMCQSC